MLREIGGPGILPNHLGMRSDGSNGIPQIMTGAQQELAEILVGYPAILTFARIEAFARIELRHEGYATTTLNYQKIFPDVESLTRRSERILHTATRVKRTQG